MFSLCMCHWITDKLIGIVAQSCETKNLTCKWMYLKNHIFKPRIQIWRHDWSSSNICEIIAWKNWFRLVRDSNTWPTCSTNWAMNEYGSWSRCEFVIIPLNGKDTSEYMKDHTWLVTLMVQKQLAQNIQLSSTYNSPDHLHPFFIICDTPNTCICSCTSTE